ncbi:MAG: signal peptidase I [Hungatella sp.]
METDRKTEQPVNWKREIWEWVKILVTAAAIAFVLNTFIIANSKVPSGSMENTIMTGDRIIGSRLSYLFDEPKRGDIVIFKHPTGPGNEVTTLVKRVIGLPGETVDIKDGKVYINGEELEEPYLKEPMDPEEEFHVEVKEGCYLMLGDNRNHSADARSWSEPNVSKDEIMAKVYFRYFPSIGKLE